MKKTLLFAALAACLLAGCSKTAVNTKTGKIDCSYISYTVDQNHTDSFQYNLSYVFAAEYKSESGAVIYGNANFGLIYLYNNPYTDQSTTFERTRIIGCLCYEWIYYLDLDSLTIDCLTKFSKYQGDIDKDYYGNPLNHNEAYQCALKGFYSGGSSNVVKGITDNTLERHSYIKLGDNTIVHYTPRIS